MRYERTFRIQSAHLNSIDAYNIVWGLAEAQAIKKEAVVDPQAVLDGMRDTHGHNYVIRVFVDGALKDGRPWLIDDPALEQVVMEFHNTNLSLHPFFLANKKRATTEELCLLLFVRLTNVAAENGCVISRVEVWESEDICASFEPAKDEFVPAGYMDALRELVRGV